VSRAWPDRRVASTSAQPQGSDLAADLPASLSADLTGISIGTGKRWSQSAKRDWAAYVGQRDRRGPRGDQQAETR
jgi:hypothetical protein